MKLRFILCLMLGLYSMGAVTYALSELNKVKGGCGAGCFGSELPFKNSTSGTRNVNVQFTETGAEGFGTGAAKISGALTTATGNWNAAGTTYQFQATQGSGTANLQIVLVDEIKGASRSACMELKTFSNGSTGEIESGILYVKKSVFNHADQTQLAELLQHELGHFIGLKDFYGNADQCQTTMAQAKDGCEGLKGSKTISNDDKASVAKYVNHSTDCKGKRTRTPVITGGYVDPNPIPTYYPYTCYYYYGAYDVYYDCDCHENGQYAYTIYWLEDVICF